MHGKHHFSCVLAANIGASSGAWRTNCLDMNQKRSSILYIVCTQVYLMVIFNIHLKIEFFIVEKTDK